MLAVVMLLDSSSDSENVRLYQVYGDITAALPSAVED